MSDPDALARGDTRGPRERRDGAALEDGAAEHGAPPPGRVPRRVVIQGTGDYVLHTRVHNSARFHTDWSDDPAARETEGYDYLVYRVAPVLAKGDVNILNLETPLATERHPQSGVPPMLNGPPVAAVSLARAGFHVASLANNHAYDQDAEGVVETRQAVVDVGMLAVGGGANEEEAHAPVFIDCPGGLFGTSCLTAPRTPAEARGEAARFLDCPGGLFGTSCLTAPRTPAEARGEAARFLRAGVRIGILAFTESVNRTTVRNPTTAADPQVAIWRGAQDIETVRQVRERCDILVVVFHWGGEFEMVPNRFQRRTAEDLCAAGVDLVLGSHTHTLQEVRRYDGPDESSCVVAYSLGNFLSNQGRKYRAGWTNPDPDRAQGIAETRDGAILRVVYEEDLEGRLQLRLVQAVPLWTENNWLQRFGVRDFRNDIYVAPLYASMADPERSERYADLYAERLEAIREALGDDVEIVPE